MSDPLSTRPVWQSVNRPEESVVLDAQGCCRSAAASGNPIDSFYDSVAHVLTLGTPDALGASATLGRLLTLGLVTATEAYFRSVLLATMTICPVAKDLIADQNLAYGALDYYGPDNLGLGLLEGVSFASESEVRKKSKQLLGLELAANKSLMAALQIYDQVCHMRHATVHAHGVLNRGNARALGVKPATETICLVFDLAHLHNAAKACSSVVRAYNEHIWRLTVNRWVDQALLTGQWQVDKHLFTPLFNTYRSELDKTAAKNASAAYASLRPTVIRRLGSRPES